VQEGDKTSGTIKRDHNRGEKKKKLGHPKSRSRFRLRSPSTLNPFNFKEEGKRTLGGSSEHEKFVSSPWDPPGGRNMGEREGGRYLGLLTRSSSSQIRE